MQGFIQNFRLGGGGVGGHAPPPPPENILNLRSFRLHFRPILTKKIRVDMEALQSVNSLQLASPLLLRLGMGIWT